LGLLEVETVLAGEKILEEARGVEIASGAPVNGYEMHIGRTDGPGTARAMLRLGARTDGAVSPDGRIAGCHLHGLFAGDAFRRAFLARLGGAGDASLVYERRVEATLDALAAHLEARARCRRSSRGRAHRRARGRSPAPRGSGAVRRAPGRARRRWRPPASRHWASDACRRLAA